MQRREQPGFDLREVVKLMPFRRPDVECLLGQIARIGLRARETHREPEERLVVIAHNRFKLIG